jgi:hypothetical protein
MTIAEVEQGQKLRLNNGKRRVYVKHRNMGNPMPVPNATGGIDYLSTATLRNSSGRTFDVLLTTQVTPA